MGDSNHKNIMFDDDGIPYSGYGMPNGLSIPRKREFRYGWRAFFRDVPINYNPWRKDRNGRSYYAFEFEWNNGWRSAEKFSQENGLKVGSDK